MASEEEYPPNETVYINNLNEKLSKDELRKCLYLFFGQYGRVLDVIAAKTMKMRGQAFVVFEDLHSSNRAIDGANGYPFFGKNMRVTYAKTKSKALLENQGKIAQAAAIARDASKLQRYKQPVKSNKRKNENNKRNKNKKSSKYSNNGKKEINESDDENENENEIEISDSDVSVSSGTNSSSNSSKGDFDIDGKDNDIEMNGNNNNNNNRYKNSNNINKEIKYKLLIEGIPLNTDKGDDISKLFQRYDDFISFELDNNNPGIAHVCYKSHKLAKKVQTEMQGYKFDIENQFRITFE